VKLENDMSVSIQIRRRVKQGCVLSPLLFNLYSEAIFQEILEDKELRIKVNGVVTELTTFIDDAILITDNIDL